MAEADESLVLNEQALDDLYAWIDQIPLSRPKKNIARDFSDGVMVAEIVANFFPKMVDIHNYFSASSAGQKKINWSTLNRRVFSKMGIRVSDVTIQQLIDSKSGAIEQVLWDLRRKILDPPTMTSSRSSSVPPRSRSPAPTGYGKTNGNGTSGPNNQTALQKQHQQIRELVEQIPIDLEGKGSSTTQMSSNQNTPSRTGSIGSYSQSAKQSHGYIVAPTANYEEPSNNNASPPSPLGCGPPAQIIYRGHKMIPLGLLEEKDREIKTLEFTNKNLTVKVHRLETLINVKDQRIEDLTHQLHSLRSIYERVTQQTWQGYT